MFSTRRIRYLALGSTALCVTALLGAAALDGSTAQAGGKRSTSDGVFTAAQAERGKVVYEQSCKNCHQAEFYAERLQLWQNKSVGALFESLSTTMPADNVGSLATSEYIDVLAYVFSITGSPTGTTELTTENYDAITIAAPK
jgi:mono/diheme cytochrome c family protein